MIRIVDNFLDEGFLDYVQHILPSMDYRLHGSVGKLNFFNTTDPFMPDRSFDYIMQRIADLDQLNNIRLLRSYVNLAPCGEIYEGEYHQDDGDITALFYPMPWSTEWQGGTDFDGQIIDYVTNRLVLFDADIPHKSVSHSCPTGFRYTVAFKIEATWIHENSTGN